jgi:hypothetical protein
MVAYSWYTSNMTSLLLVAPESAWQEKVHHLVQGYLPADVWVGEDMLLPFTVKQAQAVRSFLQTTPLGKGKIAIIHQGQSLRSEPANALLKALEEPPEYAQCVVLSTTPFVLPTIASRLRTISIAGGGATVLHPLWQEVQKTYRVTESPSREQLRNLLYLSSLMHTTLQVDVLVKPYLHS